MSKLTELTVTAKWIASNGKEIDLNEVFSMFNGFNSGSGTVQICTDTTKSSTDVSDVSEDSTSGIGRPRKIVDEPAEPKKPKISKNAFKLHGEYYDFATVAAKTGYTQRQVRHQLEKRKSMQNGKSAYKKWAIRAMEAAKKRNNLIIAGF